MADVEKRNRYRYWSSNPKLIPHATTYLNQERWDDEWEEEIKPVKEDLPNTGPVIPQVKEPERHLPWEERMFNRLGRSYVFVSGGLPEMESLKTVKNDMMLLDVPAFREEINSGKMEIWQAGLELGNAFLDRLDMAYNRGLKERVKKLAFAERKFGKAS